eukprot:6512736-Pyramimonas_sp.AAC.1
MQKASAGGTQARRYGVQNASCTRAPVSAAIGLLVEVPPSARAPSVADTRAEATYKKIYEDKIAALEQELRS